MASIEDPDRVAETELETAVALSRRIAHALTGAVEVRQELLDQALICIAAEHGEGAVAYGRDKLTRKGLDAVVVNDIGRKDIGFEGVENEVTIVTASGERHVPRTTKAAVARAVLETVSDLRTDQRATA